jgi:pre-60S factor REI1
MRDALVPARGQGGDGKVEVFKARNRGEAKEAGKEVREFVEKRKRGEEMLKKGLKGNNQKHVSCSCVYVSLYLGLRQVICRK